MVLQSFVWILLLLSCSFLAIGSGGPIKNTYGDVVSPKQGSSNHGDRTLQREKRFFINKDKAINLFNNIYGLLNSNSTNLDLNQVVFAFNTLFNSAGILSIVNSLTIIARILQIYDFPPRAVSRIETRIRNRKDREDKYIQKAINEEFRRNLTSSIDHGVDQLVTMNRAVLCILYSKPIENDQAVTKQQIRELRRQFCSPPVIIQENEVGWEEKEDDSLLLEEEIEDEDDSPSNNSILGLLRNLFTKK